MTAEKRREEGRERKGGKGRGEERESKLKKHFK
jgi:hypothetical protein